MRELGVRVLLTRKTGREIVLNLTDPTAAPRQKYIAELETVIQTFGHPSPPNRGDKVRNLASVFD